jgi:hypothetical protein
MGSGVIPGEGRGDDMTVLESELPYIHPKVDRSRSLNCGWSALIDIRLPQGVQVHPATRALLKQELYGLAPAFLISTERLRFAYGVETQSRDEAIRNGQALANRVLGMLSLDRSCLIEFAVQKVPDRNRPEAEIVAFPSR